MSLKIRRRAIRKPWLANQQYLGIKTCERYVLFAKSLLYQTLLKVRRLSLAQHSRPHCSDVEAKNKGAINEYNWNNIECGNGNFVIC